MSTTDSFVSPYLSGGAAPVTTETTAFDLVIRGKIPEELNGRWLRNGPNPIGEVDPARHHWFMGDGMIHGVRLRDGGAEWYRNRWVRSDSVCRALGEEPRGGAPLAGQRDFGPNTSVGAFAGKTWAMVEAGPVPYELTDELETVGRNTFEGTLEGPFSAHPKFDPLKGELHAMCYNWPALLKPEGCFIHYVIVGSDGLVRKTTEIEVGGMSMIHDMSLTENWAVLFDLPVTVSFDLMQEGYGFPFAWDPNYAPRIGLIRRGDEEADVIWCDVDPCYVFHPMNAFEDADGRIVIDICRYEKMMAVDKLGPFGDSISSLSRWTINPTTRTVSTHDIDGRSHEFPAINSAYGTKQHRFGYTTSVEMSDSAVVINHLYKTDFITGEVQLHHFGEGCGGAEPIFVARDGATSEDDGWIMVVVDDKATRKSELQILSAQDFSEDPVAIIEIPARVPAGFHGSWCPTR